MLRHPWVAALDCEDCKKWIVDLDKECYATRAGQRQERQPGQSTPCRNCPKQNPAEAKRLKLSRAHVKTITLYVQSRATHGASLSDAERRDPILLMHFATIDSVWRCFDQSQLAEQIAMNLPLSRKP